MVLNYITLVLDLADGTGTPLAAGQALPNPSAQLTDATDDMIVTQAQLSAQLAGSYPNAVRWAAGCRHASIAYSNWWRLQDKTQ
jgi:hypothetical protein